MKGYVYVISNKAMPDYVKVGHTTRSPKERALELGGTALPYPAVVEYSVFVDNARAVEFEVHRRLARVRANKGREWFRCSRAKAVETIKASIGPAAQREHDREVEEQRARVQAKESKRQASMKRQKEEAEKALEQARNVARAAIYAKYEPRREGLARVPHFCFFWLLGSALAWVVIGLLDKKGFSGDLLLPSCFPGLIVGFILQEQARKQKRQASEYIALEAALSSELKAVEQRCDFSGMTSTPLMNSVARSVSQLELKTAVTRTGQATITPTAPPTVTAAQPRWLVAAASPRTPNQLRGNASTASAGNQQTLATAAEVPLEAAANSAKVNVTCPVCRKLMRLPALKTVDATCPHCTHVFRVSTGTTGFTCVSGGSGSRRHWGSR
ncbi:T5orf172 domain-containing protein [Paraburkholderia sp. BL6669N2]|uniref:GIY-YIG nuclease family protein n=1 Tax=Paraburkholderia sp. BL6669N2 TaxID=1938807 RepID=UPI000E36BB71|nr:GIY-YIG nuclease family protein [Paraburkholderia sp. BL6669N2]REG59297.1 T5orf172 domain-containing protein [Paraburkholderia sp. BL6669N2]